LKIYVPNNVPNFSIFCLPYYHAKLEFKMLLPKKCCKTAQMLQKLNKSFD